VFVAFLLGVDVVCIKGTYIGGGYTYISIVKEDLMKEIYSVKFIM
jgi:hypothetical protein